MRLEMHTHGRKKWKETIHENFIIIRFHPNIGESNNFLSDRVEFGDYSSIVHPIIIF